MEKVIRVKSHIRKGKFIKGYTYRRVLKEPSFKKGSKFSMSHKDDVRRKILALKKYSDFQSDNFNQAISYLNKECPDVANLIGNSDNHRRIYNMNKNFYDCLNYAYDMLYS